MMRVFKNNPLIGYLKDGNSSSWYYNTLGTIVDSILTQDSRDVEIGNNCNFKLIEGFNLNDTTNEGLLRCQKFINKYNTEKISLLGTLSSQSKVFLS